MIAKVDASSVPLGFGKSMLFPELANVGHDIVYSFVLEYSHEHCIGHTDVGTAEINRVVVLNAKIKAIIKDNIS